MEWRVSVTHTRYGLYVQAVSHKDMSVFGKVVVIDEIQDAADARGVTFPNRRMREKEAAHHAELLHTTVERVPTVAAGDAVARAYAAYLMLPIDA